jgi:hypothetical protein
MAKLVIDRSKWRRGGNAENKENGFIDRWLLCYPDLVVPRYNRREMTEETIQWYSDYLIGFFDYIRNTYVQYSETGILIPHMGRFTAEADREWERIFNKITDLQNSDSENEYMKSILPKQKSYVARFALLLNTLYAYDNNQNPEQICLKAILGAEKLSDYFIMMAKKNKIDNLETNEIKNAIKKSGKTDAQSQFVEIYNKNKKVNKSKTAMELNVTRQTITNWIKEIESVKV